MQKVKSPPALKIYKAALQYAMSNKLPFVTVKQQNKIIKTYLLSQSQKN